MENAAPSIALKRRFCVLYFVVYLFLTCGLVYSTFTNCDEAANIFAGVSIWKTGSFDLYSVNPPLVKAIAGAPLTLCRPNFDWSEYERLRANQKPGERNEFQFGEEFVRENAARLRLLLILARAACLPFAFLGAYFSWRLASEMFGVRAGVASALFWALCPNLLTWGTVVLSDAASTSLGVVTAYYFWKWLKSSSPTLNDAIWIGLLLGVALLTKFTWLILFLLLPIQWIVWRFFHDRPFRLPLRQAGQIAIIFATGLFVVNLGYLFEGSFKPLGDYLFVSRTLAGADSIVEIETREPNKGRIPGGNRFDDSLLGKIPVPVPQNYLQGIDLQKVDFEKGMPSYLNGEWSERGWPYFYLEGAILKIPLGAWALFVIAIDCFFARLKREKRRAFDGNCLYLFLFGGVLFAFVSSQTGFSRHFRYVLPALPFFYIGVSSVFSHFEERSQRAKITLYALLGWFAVSSLWVYPHSMSYFNELVGGPRNGGRYMLDSCFDWGQESWSLIRWLDQRGRPDVNVEPRAAVIARYFDGLGRDYPSVPHLIDQELEKLPDNDFAKQDPLLVGPRPGLYAISEQDVRGENGLYRYFNDLEPVLSFGYTIHLYDVSWEDAARLRERYDLPPLERPKTDMDAFFQERLERANRDRPIRIAYMKFRHDDERSLLDFQRALPSDAFTFDVLAPCDVQDGGLNDYDLVLVPGGNASEQAHELGRVGARAIRDYVRSGGGYLGVCAGAYLASSQEKYNHRLVNARPRAPRPGAEGDTERVQLKFTRLGAKILGIADDAGEALKEVAYTGGPIFHADYQLDLSEALTLAEFDGAFDDEPAGAIALSSFGEGCACVISPHVERSESWDVALRRLVRAVARDRASNASERTPD